MSDTRFRLATRQDKDDILRFVHTHWDLEHPFIDEPDFFDYYFAGDGDALYFALAEQDGALCALAGYIPAGAGPQADVWVSYWMADPAAKGVGLELMAALPELTGCRTLACNNIRPKTRVFYEFLGYSTGRMGHFYRLAPREQYRLARIARADIPPVAGDGTLRLLATGDDLRASGFAPPAGANPRKDLWYLARRYFHYPRQTYRVYAGTLPGHSAPQALFALRAVDAPLEDGTTVTVLRIADYVGKAGLLPRFGAALDALLAEAQAEYADFYCAGISPDLLRQAGFAERPEGDDSNILPNYLSPPLMQNTDYYYFTSRPEGFTLFKADGDQDRPRTD